MNPSFNLHNTLANESFMIKEAFFYFYFLTPNNKVSRKRILYRRSDLILVVVGGLWVVVLEYMNENVSFHQKEKNTSKTQSLKPKLISTPQRAIS